MQKHITWNTVQTTDIIQPLLFFSPSLLSSFFIFPLHLLSFSICFPPLVSSSFSLLSLPSLLPTEPSVVPSNAAVVAGAVIGSLLALILVAALIAVLVTRSRRQQQGYRGNPNHSSYDIKSRIFGGGKKGSKNGTGAGAGGNGVGGNNSPIYVYKEGSAHDGLTDKANHHVPLHLGGRGEGGVATAPTAQDILLSGELDEAERRKFDQLEDDEESYDHFGRGVPILQLRPPHDQDGIMGGYLDDDMESQRDGSVISRTAVYV